MNLPELALPERAGAHRLAHVHLNTPGVLATINGVLADHGVNIEGQLLGTRGEVGYVITDIGAPGRARRRPRPARHAGDDPPAPAVVSRLPLGRARGAGRTPRIGIQRTSYGSAPAGPL